MARCPGAAGGAAADRLASVLGLRAFVLSAPYDVPAWLPGVLMVLVRAGADPPPVRHPSLFLRGGCLRHAQPFLHNPSLARVFHWVGVESYGRQRATLHLGVFPLSGDLIRTTAGVLPFSLVRVLPLGGVGLGGV